MNEDTSCEELRKIIRDLKKDQSIEYVEFDELVEPLSLPSETGPTNDPFFNSSGYWGQSYDDLWGIKKIGADEVWYRSQGGGLVVAVVDTGVDYNHEDLQANIWVNQDPTIYDPEHFGDRNEDDVIDFKDIDLDQDGEIEINELDIDGNGFISPEEIVPDSLGHDFADDDGNPVDVRGHGTHVAGTVAAVRNNNKGVVGVAPKAKIMIAKGFSDTYYWGRNSDLANAVKWSVDHGAQVINNSWGGVGSSSVISEAFLYAAAFNVFSVAAAGNDYGDDASYQYPCAYETVFCVASSTTKDEYSSFSNIGDVVDILAPGGGDYDSPGYWGSKGRDNILSTVPVPNNANGEVLTDAYDNYSGTSMASPHVAGAAALLWADNPSLTVLQLKTALKYDAVPVDDPSVQFSRAAAGRIKLPAAFAAVGELVSTEIHSAELNGDFLTLRATVNGDEFSSYSLSYATEDDPQNFVEILSSSIPVVDGLIAEDFDLASSAIPVGKAIFRLTGVNLNQEQTHDYVILEIEDRLKVNSINVNDLYKAGSKIPFMASASRDLEIIKFDYAFDIDSLEEFTSFDLVDRNGADLTVGQQEKLLGYIDTKNFGADDFVLFKVTYEYEGVIAEQEFGPIFLSSRLKVDPVHRATNVSWGRYGPRANIPKIADLDFDGFKEILQFTVGGKTSSVLSDYYTNNGIALSKLTSMNHKGETQWEVFLGDTSLEKNVIGSVTKMYKPTERQFAVADTNEDGSQEIFVLGDLLSDFESDKSITSIYALNKDGQNLNANWPLTIDSSDEDFAPAYALALADLDNDNIKEVIAYSANRTSEHKKQPLLIIDSQTAEIKSSIDLDALCPDSQDTRYISNSYSRFALGNFDEDADLEIVARAGDRCVVVVNMDGSLVNDSWPLVFDQKASGEWESFLDASPISFTVADIDLNGEEDILFVSNFEVNRQKLHVIDRHAQALVGFPYSLPTFSGDDSNPVAPSVANLDKDPELEIVISLSGREIRWGRDKGVFTVLDTDGTRLKTWSHLNSDPRTFGGDINAVSLGATLLDITGDGVAEIFRVLGGVSAQAIPSIEGSYANTSVAGLFAWDENGREIDLYPESDLSTALPSIRQAHDWRNMMMNPIFADLDGDDVLEIITTTISDISKPVDPKGEIDILNRSSLFVWSSDFSAEGLEQGYTQYMHDTANTGRIATIVDPEKPDSRDDNDSGGGSVTPTPPVQNPSPTPPVQNPAPSPVEADDSEEEAASPTTNIELSDDLQNNIDADGDGEMSEAEQINSVLEALKQASNSDDASTAGSANNNPYDLNNDGKVTNEDIALFEQSVNGDASFAKVFAAVKKVDANGDGELSTKELKRILLEHKGNSVASGDKAIQLEVMAMNKDFEAITKVVDVLDKNSNGKASRGEARKALTRFRKARRQSKRPRGRVKAKFDFDGDGFITRYDLEVLQDVAQ